MVCEQQVSENLPAEVSNLSESCVYLTSFRQRYSKPDGFEQTLSNTEVMELGLNRSTAVQLNLQLIGFVGLAYVAL